MPKPYRIYSITWFMTSLEIGKKKKNKPGRKKKKKSGKKDEEFYDFDKDNPYDCDSTYDDLLTYNEVVGFINKQVTDEDGEYWQFWKILGSIQHTLPGHRDQMGSK